jgi:type I restriction enzyme, R subunit
VAPAKAVDTTVYSSPSPASSAAANLSAADARSAAEALSQIRRYHEQGPEALAVLQLFGITHILGFKYGATWNTSHRAIYNWREEAQGDYEALVKAFVDPGGSCG